MSFLAQYELLEPISGGGVGTFKARERSSGRDVLVHQVSGNGEVQRQLLTAPADKRAQILGQGDDAGESYVVTAMLPAGVGFDDWLRGTTPTGRGQWEVAGITQSLAAKPTSDMPSPAEPGEFTKMFQSPASAAPTGSMPAAKPGLGDTMPSLRARTTEPPLPVAAPGEFTRMFQATPAAPTEALPAPQAKPPASPDSPGNSRGCFSRPLPRTRRRLHP